VEVTEVSDPHAPKLAAGTAGADRESGQASFTTGAVIPVDGGRAARGPDPEER
jgi:hypothetical protein